MKKVLLLSFVILAMLSFKAQTIAVSPQSISTQPCADSILITVDINPTAGMQQIKVSMVNDDQLRYHGYATLSNTGSIDSVVVNDSAHFYLSGFTGNNNLHFYVRPECGSFSASNYSFELTVNALFINTGANSSTSDVINVSISSPFLIIEQNENLIGTPTIGDIIVRKTIVKNTGSLPFSGSFKVNYSSDKYAEIQGFGVLSAGHLSNTIVNSTAILGSVSGDLTNFLPSDSLVFTDTVYLNSCDYDSTQTNYTFVYGCESNNMCAEIGIEPFDYPTLSETMPQLDVYVNSGDNSCYLSSDTMHFEYGVTNIGTVPAKNMVIGMYKALNGFTQTPHMVNGSVHIYLNGNEILIDSIGYGPACAPDSGISRVSDTIAEFRTGDSLYITYDLVYCCGKPTTNFNYYQTGVSSEKQCSSGIWYLHTTTQLKNFGLSQFFENFVANIQIAPGDTDRISDEAYDFSIDNIAGTFSDQVDTNANTPNTYFPLLSEGNAVIEVTLLLEKGLFYEPGSFSIESTSGAPINYNWNPFEIVSKFGINDNGNREFACGDTLIARFALPDFFYKKSFGAYQKWYYDSLNSYLSNSEILFQLRGKCPAPAISKITQLVTLIPDSNCLTSCGVQISKAEDKVAVMCPGCDTPGYITNIFELNRRSVGEKDNDNNHFPDVLTANISADKDSVILKRAIIGDTLDMYVESIFWDEGSTKLSTIPPYHLKNTIVQFIIPPNLALIDSFQLKVYDASLMTYDSISIPNSYLKIKGTPYLDLHVDTLNSKNWPKSGNFSPYNKGDRIFLNGKAKVVMDPSGPYEMVRSDVRVYGSGVPYAIAGDDVADAIAKSIQPDSTHKYWCEFAGEKTAIVGIDYSPAHIPINFIDYNYGHPNKQIVGPKKFLSFLTDRAAVTIGGAYDDSFPFEYRKLVEFDSVIIQQPDHYRMESFTVTNSGSKHDGSHSQFSSLTQQFNNPPLNPITNSYEFLLESYFKDTTELPPLNANNQILRNDAVIYSDEEVKPITTFTLIPTNCAAAIGDSIAYKFKGVLNKYPGVDGQLIIEDSLYAYLPKVILETQKISADTVYLTDTVQTSSIRLINDSENNPYFIEDLNWRYVMNDMSNIFARVIAPSSVNNVVLHGGNRAVWTYPYNDTLDLHELNNLGRSLTNYKKDVFIDYEYSCPNGVNQVVDSILVITGWNCDGYPSDLAQACQLDTNVFYIIPQPVGLDGSIVRTDTNTTCDTVAYSINLNSQGAGKMVDVRAQLDLTNSSFTLYGTTQIEYLGSTEPITIDANGYFNLNDISYFNQNGFDYSDGEVKIHFELEKIGNALSETIVVNIDGLSYCGDTIAFTKQTEVGPCVDLSADFVTTWSTDRFVTIPTNSYYIYKYNYTIIWGDGSVDKNVTGSITHDYGGPYTGEIRIRGEFDQIYFRNNGDKLKLTGINQWGNIKWASFYESFYGCSNLSSYTATDAPDLSQVESFRSAFSGCSKFNGDLNNWDMINVTDLSYMFKSASVFNGDISSWDVDNVTNMMATFMHAYDFNQDLSGWNVGKVTNMGYMFYIARKFDSDVSAWDVSKVTNLGYTFGGAANFKNGGNLSLNSWQVHNVTSLHGTFQGCTLFNSNISNWNTSKVTSLAYTFRQASIFDQDISNWDVDSVTTFHATFSQASAFKGDSLGKWDVRSATDLRYMFYYAFNFDADLSNWDVSNVTNLGYTFGGAAKFKNGTNIYMGKTMNDWDIRNVTSLYGTFQGCKLFNVDISNWNTSKVTSLAYTFKQASIFDQDISGWDVDTVTSMLSTFTQATLFNQNLKNWDVRNVTDMRYTFYSASNFNQNLGYWDVDKVTNMGYMLSGTNLSLTNYDSTIIGWRNSVGAKTIRLDAHGLHYCNSETEHDYLTTNGWTINGDDLSCPTPRKARPNEGINDESSNNFSIYPNPAQEKLFLSFETEQENLTIQIHDVFGRVVRSESLTPSKLIELDVYDLANGTYFVKIESLQTKTSKKFIIAR